MKYNRAKRDQQISQLKRQLEVLEWRIKRDEAVPRETREEITGRNLDDRLLEELRPYCRRDCDTYCRLRQQLRRLYR